MTQQSVGQLVVAMRHVEHSEYTVQVGVSLPLSDILAVRLNNSNAPAI
jgi:hypothetical protein